MKPTCPKCGQELFFQQVVRACKTTKINKDGSLSKISKLIVNDEDIDVCYLHCNNCDFNYTLTHKDAGEEDIQKFEKWFTHEYLS